MDAYCVSGVMETHVRLGSLSAKRCLNCAFESRIVGGQKGREPDRPRQMLAFGTPQQQTHYRYKCTPVSALQTNKTHAHRCQHYKIEQMQGEVEQSRNAVVG